MAQISDNLVEEINYKKFAQLECLMDSEFSITPVSYKKLFSSSTDLNYQIPSNHFFNSETDDSAGSTLLHIALNNNRHDIFDMLIDQGADFTIKNQKDMTVLHKVMERFFYTKHEEKPWKMWTEIDNPFIDSILLAHVNRVNHNNPGNKCGFTHFHAACIKNNVEAVKFFLANGISVNKGVNSDFQFAPGYTPLHFAIRYCATEVVEILIENGADISLQDEKGRNALTLLIEEKMKILIAMSRYTRINAHENYQKFRMIFQKNEQTINLLLKKLNLNVLESSNNLGLSQFHVLCTLENPEKDFLKHYSIDLKEFETTSSVWPGYTALHFAANFNVETFKLLLERGANIRAQDTNGITPFDIALQCFKIKDIHSILFSIDPTLANIRFSDGKTKLLDFIRAMIDPAEFEKYLETNITDINMFIELDSPVCAGYTPLHFTVCCTEKPNIKWTLNHTGDSSSKMFLDLCESVHAAEYNARIKSCLDLGADVTLANSNGSTPLHMAFYLQEGFVVSQFLKYHVTIVNPVDKNGLSHLHIASTRQKNDLIEDLLSVDEENINLRVNSSFIWYDTTFKRNSKKAMAFVINKGSTPLHIAALVGNAKAVGSLIEYNADVLAKDAANLNPLERILDDANKFPCHEFYYCWGQRNDFIKKILALRIIDVLTASNARQSEHNEILHHCNLLKQNWDSNLLKDSEFTFGQVLKHANDAIIGTLETIGVTMLHIACVTKNIEQIVLLLYDGVVDVNAQIHFDSPIWPGYSPLHLGFADQRSTNKVDSAILKLLLSHGADVTLKNAYGDTPLHRAYDKLIEFYAPISDFDYVTVMINGQKDFSLNPVNKLGLSHFHIACAVNATDAVQKFIDQGVDVNQTTHPFSDSLDVGEMTPLHAAASYMYLETIDILLNHGANVHARNVFDSTALHCVVDHPRAHCPDVLRRLIRAGADVNAKNLIGQTPLELLFKSLDFIIDEVNIILEAGAHLMTINSINGRGCMAAALWCRGTMPNSLSLIINAPDVKNIDEMGHNAIHAVVSLEPYWDNVDDDSGFIRTSTYNKVINGLINLGLDIDHKNNKGFTPLHTAVQMQNVTGVKGLLNNGSDINLTDASGQTAFSYILERLNLITQTKDSKIVDQKILKWLFIHLYKLHFMKLEISTLAREYLRTRNDIQQLFDIDVFQSELNSTKMWCVVPQYNITLYDLLSETGVVAVYPFMLSLRQNLQTLLTKKRSELRKKFPELVGILLLQYRKALARVNLIEPAMVSLPVLLKFNIPDVCSVIILRFLNNTELTNLIESTNMSI